MGIHGAAVPEIIVTPEAVQQVVPGKNLLRIGGQQPEQLLFPFGQGHFVIVNGDHVIIDINGKVGDGQLAGFALLLLGDAPQDRPGPGHDFRRAEGFHNIIVCADVQPHDLIRVLAPGRNHDNRHLGHGADRLAYGKTVLFRHHHIQENDGDLF